ncbi:3-phytase [Luteimonas cucumeris]|uniref:3-phytase n=1 Tax=Luteimonas cucumeris TaxID=985012 RepID=A0A562L0C2_9GAMM|nr:phytase [Luteimonas cucumeris]TWI01091.1 3-phytase [Luteimonas cucumeris]
MSPHHALAPILLSLCFAALLPGCATPAVDREPDETAEVDPMLAGSGIAHRVVKEAFVTPLTPQDNIDSPALWMAPDGSALLLATGKKSGHLVAYDGDTGAALGARGSRGTGPGQFDRPNGIFVHDDLVFVVERDNHRVQVLRLPGMQSLGSFGDADLQKPYGLWLHPTGANRFDVLVSDAYMAGEDARGDEIPPPLAELGARFKRYAVSIDGDRVAATLAGTVGDTTAAGAIRVPESLWGDAAHDRLLIAEEDLATGTAVREYGMDGRFRGRTLGLGMFKAQAEGIALWQCTDGSGYWITTDQFKDRSLFHVWDRATLAHLGAFAGETVGNTDGVWLHQGATKRFPQGVFYAVHDDMGVGAFDWRDIAATLGLKVACEG